MIAITTGSSTGVHARRIVGVRAPHVRMAHRRRETGTGSRPPETSKGDTPGGRVPVPVSRAGVRCGENGDRQLRCAAEPVPVFASATGLAVPDPVRHANV